MPGKFEDLRQWLDQVDVIGELVRPDGADWNPKIGGISELDCKKRGPALPFEQIMGHLPGHHVLTSSTTLPAGKAAALPGSAPVRDKGM